MTRFQLLVLPLLVSGLAACSQDLPPSRSGYTPSPVQTPSPQPNPTPKPNEVDTKTGPDQATLERCGYDFNDEWNRADRATFLRSLEGLWIETMPGFTRREVEGGAAEYTKGGFQFDTQRNIFGFIQFSFSRPSSEVVIGAHSEPTLSLNHLRISRPLSVSGFEGARFVSVYDEARSACWTTVMRVNEDGVLSATSVTLSSGQLSQESEFFDRGRGVGTFKRVDSSVY